MKFKVKISGLDSWSSDWNLAEHEALEKVKDAVDEHAHKIESGTKRNAPVDTGRLKGSYTTEIDNDGYSAEVGSDVEYADEVENGNSKQAAQPHLKPAYVKQEPLFIKDIQNIIDGMGE